MIGDTVIRTLLEDLLDPTGRGLDAACLNGAIEDMRGRVRGMPRYMGAGMTALTLTFALTGYTHLPKERRVARLDAWRKGPVSLMRDFVEFWEKMGTFTYWSRVEKAAH